MLVFLGPQMIPARLDLLDRVSVRAHIRPAERKLPTHSFGPSVVAYAQSFRPRDLDVLEKRNDEHALCDFGETVGLRI
jgi:hypothetical protein